MSLECDVVFPTCPADGAIEEEEGQAQEPEKEGQESNISRHMVLVPHGRVVQAGGGWGGGQAALVQLVLLAGTGCLCLSIRLVALG